MPDVRIRLGRSDYPLRPSYGAFSDIEEATGIHLAELYQLHRLGGLKLAELAQIVVAGARAAGDTLAPDATAERLFEARAATDAGTRRAVAAYLLELLWAPEDAKKKLAEEWDGAGVAATIISPASSGPRTRSAGGRPT